MSVAVDAPGRTPGTEDSRRLVHRLFEEVARLSEMDLSPADYYSDFLRRVLTGLSAPAGAVWIPAEQGGFQLQYQINLRAVGLDRDGAVRQGHQELLRQCCEQMRSLHFLPHSSPGGATTDGPAANLTDYEILLAPVVVDRRVVGIVEVYREPQGATPLPGAMPFLVQMANWAALYARNYHVRHVLGQQHLWTQLETLTCQLHASLNPTEVAYVLANEGRRLLDADRLSVALRRGRHAAIEAVSGTDVIEKRSSLIQLMQRLFQRVLAWDDQLVYHGTRDDSLPPDVLQALDAYLARSPSKLLIVWPLRDARETRDQRPSRSALLLESFEATVPVEQMAGRLEVLGRHAASALYNASEHRRIPLRWLWRPLALLRDGAGGKVCSLATLAALAVVGLFALLVFVPRPLKVEAKGQLLPQERQCVYSPVEGQVIGFEEGLQPGSLVSANQPLVLLYDVQLEIKLSQLANEIAGAQQAVEALARQENAATSEADRMQFASEKRQKEFLRDRKLLERKALHDRTNVDESRPGNFWLKSPMQGTLLSWDFRENLTNRYVKPTEPLLKVGNKEKSWEIELKIPHKDIAQIIYAFDPARPAQELDVDLLLVSAPTRIFKGKLARNKIAGEAGVARDSAAGSEPVVLASIRIDGLDIPESQRVPRELLIPGTEIHARVCCGDRPLGYSLFYGVWEFVYEKVVFLF